MGFAEDFGSSKKTVLLLVVAVVVKGATITVPDAPKPLYLLNHLPFGDVWLSLIVYGGSSKLSYTSKASTGCRTNSVVVVDKARKVKTIDIVSVNRTGRIKE